MLNGYNIRHFIYKTTKIRIPTLGKVILLLAFLTGICMYVSVAYYFGKNRLRDLKYLDHEKCPACYGRKLCMDFQSGAIKFTGLDGIPALKFINLKNVFYGTYRGDKVVLKKLAHDDELDTADKRICELAKKDKCNVAHTLFMHKFQDDDVLHPMNVKGISSLTACPSTRLMQRVEDKVLEREKYLLHSQKLILYTTILVNPEPIILQIFPKSEGWPFPKYYGACGRFIMEEYAGEPLSKFYDSPWLKRVDLAYQIFKIAELFTNNDQDYALYFTDIDWMNYAVDDKGKVTVIDAENIIVVDKKMIRELKPPEWDIPLYSKYDKCKEYSLCLSFSEENLCTHVTADFNYYAVCRDLLSPMATDRYRPNGLLHHIPAFVDETWHLEQLLTECARPSALDGRLQNKEKLMEALDKLRTFTAEG